MTKTKKIFKTAATNFAATGVNSLPKTVTRQHRGCNLNPGPSAHESSMLTTRLPSHPTSNCLATNPKASLLKFLACAEVYLHVRPVKTRTKSSSDGPRHLCTRQCSLPSERTTTLGHLSTHPRCAVPASPCESPTAHKQTHPYTHTPV